MKKTWKILKNLAWLHIKFPFFVFHRFNLFSNIDSKMYGMEWESGEMVGEMSGQLITSIFHFITFKNYFHSS